jgi:hypothetical protein
MEHTVLTPAVNLFSHNSPLGASQQMKTLSATTAIQVARTKANKQNNSKGNKVKNQHIVGGCRMSYPLR